MKIGDTDVTVKEFKGYKAELALAIVSRMLNRLSDVVGAIAKAERDYSDANPIRITRDMAAERTSSARSLKAEAEALLADEDALRSRAERDNREEWEQEDDEGREALVVAYRATLKSNLISLEGSIQANEQTLRDMGDRPFLELPGPAPDNMDIAVGLSKAMDVAPDEIKKLLGLAVIPNADLRKAADDGREAAEQEILKRGSDLFFEGDLDELIVLFMEAATLIIDAAERARGPLERWNALYKRATNLWGRNRTETETDSRKDSPDSSTPSPAPTDGAEETSSSTSPGVSSVPSATS